jgi:ribokinase
MYDLITVGSATLDIIAKSDQFVLSKVGEGMALCERYGEKMDIADLVFTSGGGATNVAVACSRLGLKTAAVCEIGKDFASEIIISDLRREKVDDQFLIKERLEETAVSIILVGTDGGRSALTHRGAAYQLESRDIPWQHLDKTRWLHLGTLGGHKEMIFDLFEYAKHHQMSVSWTPSLKDLALFGEKKLHTSVIECQALVLNKTEWMSVQSLQDALLKSIPLIIVTDGKEGGFVYQQGRKLFDYQSVAAKVIEETGAGDAFTSGVIHGLIVGKNITECVEQGKKNAASVIQALGAKKGLLTKKQMV